MKYSDINVSREMGAIFLRTYLVRWNAIRGLSETREGLPRRTTSPKINLNLEYAMTKAELVDAIAQETGLSKAKAESALKACTSTIEGALRKGDSVSLIGFGTFSVIQRAARTGRNPRDPGKILNIPASKAVKFKAGSKLKQAVN